MYRNGRGDSSRSRRRGSARRKQCVGVLAAVLVIYLVYRSFMPDRDNTKLELIKASKLSQKMLVQGELRNHAPKTETPFNPRPDLSRSEDVGNILIEDGDNELNDNKNNNNNGPGEGDVNQSLTDRYHLVKTSLNETKQNDVTQDNTTSVKSNMTFPPESARRMDPFASNNNTRVSANLAESNLTSTERIGPLLLHKTGNITSNRLPLNTSLIPKNGYALSNDKINGSIEEHKTNITEDFAAQTKQLVLFVKETLTNNKMHRLDLNLQNKTHLDRNITNLVESFAAKAQNVLSLAKDLLTNRSTSALETSQNIMRLNSTELEKQFSIESQYIVKMANEALLKTNKTELKEKFEEKTNLLDKYLFHAQKLSKFASSLLTKIPVKVVEKQQKLLNIELPEHNKSPFEVRNVTERSQAQISNQQQN